VKGCPLGKAGVEPEVKIVSVFVIQENFSEYYAGSHNRFKIGFHRYMSEAQHFIKKYNQNGLYSIEGRTKSIIRGISLLLLKTRIQHK